MRIIRI